MEELIQAFSLERIIKSGAKFNPEKAKWFNQQYLRKHSDGDLAQRFMPVIREHGIDAAPEKVEHIVSLIKERAYFIKDFWDLSEYFFVAPQQYDPAQKAKHWKAESPALMQQVRQLLSDTPDFEARSLEETLHGWIEANQLKMGAVMNALRLCIVGAPKGPGMADILEVIGRTEALSRLDKALIAFAQ